MVQLKKGTQFINMAKLVHNVQKKQHRERSQLTGRSRLGFLEKHKDYVKRAQDYHKKDNTLKILRGKAKERNPDEYYHAMTSRKVDQSGLLFTSRRSNKEDSTLTMDQVKLLKTQDSNYVRTLRQMEKGKLEKKSKELMFESDGKHTIFVDDRKEMENFRPEEYFNTTTEMLSRRENRLTRDQLMSDSLSNKDPSIIMPKESLNKKKLKTFKRVKNHLERESQLKSVQQRMDLQREVMKKGSKKKITGPNGKTSFQWKKQRKR